MFGHYRISSLIVGTQTFPCTCRRAPRLQRIASDANIISMDQTAISSVLCELKLKTDFPPALIFNMLRNAPSLEQISLTVSYETPVIDSGTVNSTLRLPRLQRLELASAHTSDVFTHWASRVDLPVLNILSIRWHRLTHSHVPLLRAVSKTVSQLTYDPFGTLDEEDATVLSYLHMVSSFHFEVHHFWRTQSVLREFWTCMTTAGAWPVLRTIYLESADKPEDGQPLLDFVRTRNAVPRDGTAQEGPCALSRVDISTTTMPAWVHDAIAVLVPNPAT